MNQRGIKTGPKQRGGTLFQGKSEMNETALELPQEHVGLDYDWVTDRLAVGGAIWTRSNMWMACWRRRLRPRGEGNAPTFSTRGLQMTWWY